jgi:hypothetical protein
MPNPELSVLYEHPGAIAIGGVAFVGAGDACRALVDVAADADDISSAGAQRETNDKTERFWRRFFKRSMCEFRSVSEMA